MPPPGTATPAPHAPPETASPAATPPEVGLPEAPSTGGFGPPPTLGPTPDPPPELASPPLDTEPLPAEAQPPPRGWPSSPAPESGTAAGHVAGTFTGPAPGMPPGTPTATPGGTPTATPGASSVGSTSAAAPTGVPAAAPAGPGQAPGPGTGPGTGTGRGTVEAGQDAVDPAVARELKRKVAAALHQQLSGNADSPGGAGQAGSAAVDQDSLRQRGRALIEEAVARWSDAHAQTQGVAPTRQQDRALAEAVFDLLFRAGRLQPYLDDPDIENIVINGCDQVWISRADEPLHQVAPVADTDDELVELLQDLARRHGGGERMLSTSSPLLALRLDGGMRLQAMMAVTPRPYVAIRRHRVASATLGDMVRLGTIDSTLASFLAACIRARKNVMITGTQGVGKTSLLRAMAAEIPPDERIGTLETEYELWLHELGHLHQVVPMEAREGNGERVDGQAAGEIALGDLIPAALRMALSRIVVGEVRSSEVVPMLRVMTNGEGGSMCTLHARGPHMIVDRITELCLEYGPRMTDALAYRLTANALDFVVHLRMVDETALDGRRHRFVSHVLELTGLGENGRPATNTVFAPRPDQDEPRAVPHTPPSCLDDLRRVGFDPDLLAAPAGTWPGALRLHVPGEGR